MAHLLGLNSDDIKKKYALDTQIEMLERAKDERQAEVQITEDDSGRSEAALAVKRSELSRLAKQLDAFDFREEESRVNKEVVGEIERRTALLNEQLYKHTYDIAQMEESLAQKVEFRLDAVKQIYDETATYIPAQLLRDYESLVIFNKS